MFLVRVLSCVAPVASWVGGTLVFGLIENWIDKTNRSYFADSKTCIVFEGLLSGYFSRSLLEATRFVVVDEIPFPNVPVLKRVMSGGAVGITFKHTYYLAPSVASDPSVHFHELVHVLQWRYLGAKPFIRRYLMETLRHGYRDAPLEIMSYALQQWFEERGEPFDVESCVHKYLKGLPL